MSKQTKIEWPNSTTKKRKRVERMEEKVNSENNTRRIDEQSLIGWLNKGGEDEEKGEKCSVQEHTTSSSTYARGPCKAPIAADSVHTFSPILDFKLTREQDEIINNEHESILVNGVPGSAKTTTLCLRLVNKISNKSGPKYNIILLAKVSNVMSELVERIEKYLPNITFVQPSNSGSSRITAEYNGHCIELSNSSAFIHSQLQFYYNEKKPKYFEYEYNGMVKQKHVTSLRDIAKEFTLLEKIYNFLIKQNQMKFKLKNGNAINKIIFDEVQDFTQTQACMILSITENAKDISFEGYGDILQSIWYKFENNKYTKGYPPTSICIFKKIENIKEYPLSKCFRCPYHHCELLKRINKDANKRYNRKEIESIHSENDHDKPMYFMHGNITNNEEAEKTAQQIYTIITEVMKHDESIKAEDIVITASSINNNSVFEKLESILKKNDIKSVLYQTKSENGDNTTIDMNKLKEDKCSNCNRKFKKKRNNCKKCGTLRKTNKIALISGHGFKGGERRCVIVFGISEMALPKQNRPGMPNELNDISLCNVLCSRSQKYMFIGSNSSPSRYLTNNIYNLGDVLYIAQDFSQYLKNINVDRQNPKFLKKLCKSHNKKNIADIRDISTKSTEKSSEKFYKLLQQIAINDLMMPELYKKVSEKLTQINGNDNNNNLPLQKLLKNINDKLNTPDKNELTVTAISDSYDEYECVDELLNECVNIDVNNIGEPCKIAYNSMTNLLGHLPNIYIEIKQQGNFWHCLQKIANNNNILYIDEEKYPICNILKDNFKSHTMIEGISSGQLFEIIENNINYKKKGLKPKIVDLYGHRQEDHKLLLLPSYFENISYYKDIISKTTNNECWNTCLLYDYIYTPTYIQSSHMINNSDEYFTGQLDNSISNMQRYFMNINNLKIEIPCKKIKYNETDEKLLHKELLLPKAIKEYPCSITGRIDAHSNNTLYEFKMSTNEGQHKPWLLQVILYCMIGIQPFALNVGGHYGEELDHESFRTVEIYNFITGQKYNIAIDFNKLATYKTVLFEEILTEFNYHTKLKNKFLNNIETELFI
jgi:hypothetical protein